MVELSRSLSLETGSLETGPENGSDEVLGDSSQAFSRHALRAPSQDASARADSPLPQFGGFGESPHRSVFGAFARSPDELLSSVPSFSMRAPNSNETKKESPGEFIANFGYQIGKPLINYWSRSANKIGLYNRTYGETYGNMSHDHFANEPAWLKKLYTKEEMGPFGVLLKHKTDAQRSLVYGAKLSSVAAMGFTLSHLVNGASNAAALGSSEPMTIEKKISIGSTATSAFLNAGSNGLLSAGTQFIGHNDARAVSLLLPARRLDAVQASIGLFSGGSHIFIEIQEAQKEQRPVNNSMVGTGLLEMSGSAGSLLITTGAMKAASNTQEPLTKALNLTSQFQYSPKLASAVSFFSAVGPIAGMAVNVNGIHEGFMSKELNSEQKDEKIISSSFGLAGSVFLLGAAVSVTAAMAPIAGVCLFVGGTLLVGQALYDYRKPIVNFVTHKDQS
jgi:hypothetical protein